MLLSRNDHDSEKYEAVFDKKPTTQIQQKKWILKNASNYSN